MYLIWFPQNTWILLLVYLMAWPSKLHTNWICKSMSWRSALIDLLSIVVEFEFRDVFVAHRIKMRWSPVKYFKGTSCQCDTHTHTTRDENKGRCYFNNTHVLHFIFLLCWTMLFVVTSDYSDLFPLAASSELACIACDNGFNRRENCSVWTYSSNWEKDDDVLKNSIGNVECSQ